ncbi:MAG: PEP-CTERM sorting domain-containing protein [Pirellulaceae bacterium]
MNGTSVTNPDARRGRQATNADIDTTSAETIAASWSSNEQFGIDGVTRFSTVLGPFVLGDFGVTYDSLTNKLYLENNFDPATFVGFPVFRVDSPTFVSTASGFTVSGDLLVDDLFGASFGLTPSEDIGFFSMNAITAVPEPSSAVLLVMSSLGLALMRRRKLHAR